jgi:hypothetical protein
MLSFASAFSYVLKELFLKASPFEKHKNYLQKLSYNPERKYKG